MVTDVRWRQEAQAPSVLEAAGGQAESGARAPLATRIGIWFEGADKKKTLESLDAPETTLAREFPKRVKSLGQGISRIVRPWNVVEIHPASMVVLPEEEEGALNVLELVIQPADGKFGVS